MVSILILTLNEEENIQRCLDSVSWSDDIVVLDSFSSDRTVPIAEKAGARVFQRKFDDWATHQNWALQHIPFRNPWVYYSDADEVVTPELGEELRRTASGSNRPVAYRVRYRNFFMGRWMRHCGIYPAWILRFFKPGRVRFERTVNPTCEVDGEEGRLQEHFEHYSFSKGLDAWVDKHNQYSTQEALETLRFREQGCLSLRGLVSTDPVLRRRALKELSFFLPFRPTLRFGYMYLLRAGFLDGVAGFHYCRLLALYEYLIVMKAKEMQLRRKGKWL